MLSIIQFIRPASLCLLLLFTFFKYSKPPLHNDQPQRRALWATPRSSLLNSILYARGENHILVSFYSVLVFHVLFVSFEKYAVSTLKQIMQKQSSHGKTSRVILNIVKKWISSSTNNTRNFNRIARLVSKTETETSCILGGQTL